MYIILLFQLEKKNFNERNQMELEFTIISTVLKHELLMALFSNYFANWRQKHCA